MVNIFRRPPPRFDDDDYVYYDYDVYDDYYDRK